MNLFVFLFQLDDHSIHLLDLTLNLTLLGITT